MTRRDIERDGQRIALGMSKRENAQWWAKQKALVQSAKDLRELALQQIESRYELEDDEGGSARDKARRIYKL